VWKHRNAVVFREQQPFYCSISAGVRLVSGKLDYLEIKNLLTQLGLAA
jgi:hypothetical protein